MKRNLKNHLKLFKETLVLSAFTFGGGFVIVSLMKKRFVDKEGWIGEEEMLNLAVIAQSSPGAIAVNASVLVGWKLLGFTGAVTAVFGTILPPLIILSLISLSYKAFRENEIVRAVLKGMMTGVAAVIIDVVISMAGKILKERKLIPVVIIIGAFTAYYIFHINVAYVILFFGVLSALISLHDNKTGKRHL
ncbi:MAG: chromate transporter [Eubacteriales bacterium]|nr:chromate transporter [Eubacteriales bacterium]MDD4717445.1 chromate transporter [Eubacteriales bacterium]